MIAWIILCFCIQSSFGQAIAIIFVSPSPQVNTLQLEGSTLNIAVVIISSNQIDSVSANVSGRQTPLTFNSITGHYEGILNLAGLSQDTLTCQVTAKDVQNNQQSASQAFIYAIPPQLIIESPVSMSTATPLININAKCIGGNHCLLNVSAGNLFGDPNPLSYNFVDSVD